MAESKILEDDRDEWFYNSLKRYTNLYMYDLEFPVDATEVIDDTSICLSGLQNYSKKCEILQLSVPIKLLPKHIEDGLCKDRDFKILSGGYAKNRITQIKPLKSFPNYLATIQNGPGGCTIFKLGDEEHGVITENAFLTSPDLTSIKSSTLATLNDQIIVSCTSENPAVDENVIYQWKLGEGLSSSLPTKHLMKSKINDSGAIRKLKFWDENTVLFCTSKGFISLLDLREKNLSNIYSPEVNQSQETSSSPLIYSFDCIANLNKIGIVNSNGGLFTTDIRNTKEIIARDLPDMKNINAILGEKFNLEYDPKSSAEDTKFVVTGMKQDNVPVFKELEDGILSVFTHDGHSKTVTNVCWHSLTENLLFSTSIDSVIHAWQYISEDKKA